MDGNLSECLKEAYATAPTNEILHETLEFKHSGFKVRVRDENGDFIKLANGEYETTTTSIKVVNDFEDLVAYLEPEGYPEIKTTDSDGVVSSVAQGVDENGKYPEVTFNKFAFKITLPSTSEGASKELLITIDNVSEEISKNLDDTIGSHEKVQVVYRPYLSKNPKDLTSDSEEECRYREPQINPPYTFVLKTVVVNAFKITATATFDIELLSKPFPNNYYTSERFPGLAR